MSDNIESTTVPPRIFDSREELKEAIWLHKQNQPTPYGKIASWRFDDGLRDMSHLFAGYEEFNEDISGWDVSHVTNMNYMLSGCRLFNQDLSPWFRTASSLVPRTTNGMFSGCTELNQNVSRWNVSQVTNMSCMFESCESFNQDLSSWDVSNVTDMTSMFAQCTSFNSPVFKWKGTPDIDTTEMFSDCHVFNQDLSHWDVSNFVSMTGLFLRCHNFNSDISNWDVSNVVYMDRMFEGCRDFNAPIEKWNVGNSPKVIGHMFYNATSFNRPIHTWKMTINKKEWNENEYGAIFYNTPKLSKQVFTDILLNWKVDHSSFSAPYRLVIDLRNLYGKSLVQDTFLPRDIAVAGAWMLGAEGLSAWQEKAKTNQMTGSTVAMRGLYQQNPELKDFAESISEDWLGVSRTTERKKRIHHEFVAPPSKLRISKRLKQTRDTEKKAGGTRKRKKRHCVEKRRDTEKHKTKRRARRQGKRGGKKARRIG